LLGNALIIYAIFYPNKRSIMTDHINTLETCWYISPPWRQQLLPLALSLLEKVYLPSEKVAGYCCGVEWSDDG
jgi:hypothetical protein